MKKFIFVAAAVAAIFLASCGSKTNEKGEYVIKAGEAEYEVRVKLFGNGKIESIQQVKNGQPDGFFASFYKSGNTKNVGTVKDGKKDGAGIVFYPDGSVNSVGEYKNDQQNGYFWLFDRNKELLEKREYRIVDGKSRMNQWLRLNPMLQTVSEESNYITLKPVKDTIKQGETYELAISLAASFHKEYMAVIIGPFDEEYKLPTNSNCDTLIARNFSTVYKTNKYNAGQNIIRGIVQDISVNADKSNAKVRSIYFTKDFLVRK
jgi:hypothetical protein